MDYHLPEDRMPEAEVSLRLAFYLLALPDCHGTAEVAIDGAQIRVHGEQVFPIAAFLRELAPGLGVANLCPRRQAARYGVQYGHSCLRSSGYAAERTDCHCCRWQ